MVYVLLLRWLWYVGGIDWGVKLLTFQKCDSNFFQFTFFLIESVKPWQFGISNLATWRYVFKLCRNTPIGNCAPNGSQYICVEYYFRRKPPKILLQPIKMKNNLWWNFQGCTVQLYWEQLMLLLVSDSAQILYKYWDFSIVGLISTLCRAKSWRDVGSLAYRDISTLLFTLVHFSNFLHLPFKITKDAFRYQCWYFTFL